MRKKDEEKRNEVKRREEKKRKKKEEKQNEKKNIALSRELFFLFNGTRFCFYN